MSDIIASAEITVTDVKDGVGIDSVVTRFLVTHLDKGVTISTGDWSVEPPSMDVVNKYLWSYETITYTDGHKQDGKPAIIGVYGEDGVGIENIFEYYLVSDKSTSILSTDSRFKSTIPTMDETNRYLWKYEEILYTNNERNSTSPVVVGVYGDKGTSIKNIKNYYLATSASSGVSRDTDGFKETMQPLSLTNKYLWNYETIEYENPTSFQSTDPVIIGVHGEDGKDGADAKLLYLTSTLETMSFNADGAASPTSQTATIEAKLQNASGSISFIAKAYNGTSALSNSIALGGSGNSRTFSVSNFPSNATHVSITATLGSLTDTVSIFKLRHGKEGVGGAPGQNAIVGYLTNESITLGANSSGIVGSFTPATGTFKMFDGTTEVTTSENTSYSLEGYSGLVAKINSSTGVYSITAMSANTATAEFKATYNGVSIFKTVTLSKSIAGEKGDPGENAPLIKLSGDTQVIKISEDGVKTPNSNFTVTGKSLNADIEKWEYAVNGGSFSTNLPAGVTRSNNIVTINPGKINFNTLSIQATGAGVSDTFTVAQMADGLNAYTVLLSNESHTFQADTQKAVASSATTDILAYRGTKRMPVSVQSVTGLPEGMTHTVSNDGKDNANITFNATTSLTSPSGLVSINLIIDGQQITKEFSYALSFKGDTGERGLRGLQGLEGPEGKQGIPGEEGKDGQSSYTHIAYATGDQGQSFNDETFPQATYIGMYVSPNQNSSGNWRDYKWTLIKGGRGEQGLPGKEGVDGKTPYFHTAWANNSTGTDGFSRTASSNKLYIGTYTSYDSNPPAAGTYNWVKIKGEKGDTGDSAISAVLTNESITFAADKDGEVQNYVGNTGSFLLMEGTINKSEDTNTKFSLVSQTNVTATINSNSGSYTISAMTKGTSVTTGQVTFRATYKGTTIDKTVTISKSIAGQTGGKGDPGAPGGKGDPGAPATSYWITSSVDTITVKHNGDYDPKIITYYGYSKTGSNNTQNYAGRFIIQTSIDGINFTEAYRSLANMNKVDFSVPENVLFIKAKFYQAGGTTYLLDEQTTPILHSADGLKGVGLEDKDYQVGTEIFTDKADDSFVHVDIDGKSYQHAGSGKNLLPHPEQWTFSGGATLNSEGVIVIPSGGTVRVDYYWDGDTATQRYGFEVLEGKGRLVNTQYFDVDGSGTVNTGGNHNSNGNGTNELSLGEHSFGMPELDSSVHRVRLAISVTSQFGDNNTLKIRKLWGGNSSKIQAYEPPTPTPDYPIEIHSLNDFDVVSQKSEGGTIDDVEVGGRNLAYPIYNDYHSYGGNVTSTVVRQDSERNILSYLVKVKEGQTYIATQKGIGQNMRYFWFKNNPIENLNSEVSIGGNYHDQNILNVPLTPPTGANWIFIVATLDNDTHPVSEIKFERGSKATDWTPAPEDTSEGDNHRLIDKINLLLSEPLRSVGDVKDRLFRDSDGLWKVERNIDVVNKITGYDSFSFSAQSTGRPDLNRFNASSSLGAVAGYGNAISSHVPTHTNISFGSVTEESVDVHPGTGNITLFLDNDRASTTIELRNWMMNNNVEIQYIVEPRIESLDQELQDKLDNLRSFQDSNHVYTAINNKTDIISEGLKPTLHATFKGGGYYARWKPAHDLEKTTEYIEQEIKRTQNTAWIRAGMRVGYSSFTQANPNSVYICGLEYRDGYRDMVLVDKPAEIYIRESNETALIPNQSLTASGIPAETTAYVVWDNTKKTLYLAYFESKMTETGVSKKRWRNISGDTITFTDSLFAIGEIEV